MQKQYEAIVAQNKSLQSELRLANKMIELMAKELTPNFNDLGRLEMCYNHFESLSIKELGE